MSHRLKAVVRYVIIIFITAFLIWFSLRGVQVEEGQNKWQYLLSMWRIADKGWLMLMAAIGMLSHVIRALRWKMLIDSTNHPVKLSTSFLSLMIGYLVNLVIPRGGEVSRCYNLFKLEGVPVDESFGTVVVERVVDLLCLLLLLGFAFVMESDKLLSFVETLPITTSGHSSKLQTIMYLIGAAGIFFIIVYWVVRRSKRVKDFIVKTWSGIKKGILSVFQLKNKWLFAFHSVLIWFLYFLMSYAVIMAFPSTSHLGVGAVMSLFGIGAIAMAAPLPGGTGSYHVLVPQGLVFLYGVPHSDAVGFTFIFHGWQTLIMIVGGAVSLIISSLLIKKSSLKPI